MCLSGIKPENIVFFPYAGLLWLLPRMGLYLDSFIRTVLTVRMLFLSIFYTVVCAHILGILIKLFQGRCFTNEL